MMHELTNTVVESFNRRCCGYADIDKIITGWLEEKAGKIEGQVVWQPIDETKAIQSFASIGDKSIYEILGLNHQSLEEKFKDYGKPREGMYYEVLGGLAEVAKQHFKEHPEDLE